MLHKKFYALLLASFLALAFAAAPALAAATPPAIDDTYTIDGVTYYNVNSANFDSDKKFYEDVFKAKHSSIGDRSLAELWMLAAVGVGRGLFPIADMKGMSSTLDSAKEAVLKGQYGAEGVGEPLKEGYYQYSYTAPQWNNEGYVETTLNVNRIGSFPLIIRVRFSDFGVGILLPGNTGHYVSTVIETDTPKGEQASTTLKNDSGNTTTMSQTLSNAVTESLASTINHSFSYGFKEGVKMGFQTEANAVAVAFKLSAEMSFELNQTISDGWSNSKTNTKNRTVNNSISVHHRDAEAGRDQRHRHHELQLPRHALVQGLYLLSVFPPRRRRRIQPQGEGGSPAAGAGRCRL